MLIYRDSGDGGPEEDLELPHFDFIAVADATSNFAFQNKVGRGGFGEVYKVPFLGQSIQGSSKVTLSRINSMKIVPHTRR